VRASLHLVDEADRANEWLLGGAVRYLGGSRDGFTDLRPETLNALRDRFGGVPDLPRHEVLERIEAARLSGRGGAHFPVAAKWRTVRATHRSALAVANGAEGEPLSRKDAALLELRPHLVLDGLEIAARTLRADEAVVWLHEDSHGARSAINRALAERRASSCDTVPARVEVGPSRYLTGESSAVVSALSGGPTTPQFRRAPQAVSGVDGRPTLIQNVETLARVAMLIRNMNTTASTLLTVAGDHHLVVVEARAEVTVRDVVHATLGNAPRTAVLLGGYGGIWAPWAKVADLPVDEVVLRQNGLTLGAGVMLPLAGGSCGLHAAARIVRYLADSGARQCGPCRFGLPALADVLAALVDGRASRSDLRRLKRYSDEMAGRGACHHPDGAVRMIGSATVTFEADVQAHLRGRCLEAGR
jgi:NADH:ubiquinone oxidoreductase subunit F (NADH-binding)